MGFTVSSLTDYVNENKDDLIMAATLEGKTAQIIKAGGTIHTGIKSAETINILTTGVGFQADSCGFNTSGSTVFTQRTLTVGKIKVNEDLCPKDLNAKYTQKRLAAGSKDESFGFEKWYTELKAAKIAEALERAIWQGDTTSGNDDLAQFDGLVKLIKAASGTVDANVAAYNGQGGAVTAATGVTSSNVIAIFKGIKNAIPATLKGKSDVKVFCGYDKADTYIDALIAANYFNYANALQGTGGDYKIVIPGTSIEVVPVHGLDNVNFMCACQVSNLHLGVDLMNEEENFELFYAKEAGKVRFDVRFKMGTQIGIASEIVKFNMA